MKRVKHIFSAIVACLMLATNMGCNGPKEIPDEDLINIFHDAFLANAYMNKAGIYDDSLALYEPIFERYGYTIEDMHHTIKTFSERKSALISDLMREVNSRLEAEARAEARNIVILDTLDNLAKRTYTRTVYADSLIEVNRFRDTSKLRITIGDIIPGEYTVSFDYYIDTLDENRNSRVEVYALTTSEQQSLRHTLMLSRYRDGNYSRRFTLDTSHKELFINMFYHPQNEESKMPGVRISNLRVVRVLPTAVAVDSLYHEQLDIDIFNHSIMTSFTADTTIIAEPEIIEIESQTITPDSLLLHESQDSLALRTH